VLVLQLLILFNFILNYLQFLLVHPLYFRHHLEFLHSEVRVVVHPQRGVDDARAAQPNDLVLPPPNNATVLDGGHLLRALLNLLAHLRSDHDLVGLLVLDRVVRLGRSA